MAEREYRQISDLPTGITPITGAEIVELEQDGVSRKFSMVALSGVVAEHKDKHQFDGDDPVGTHDLVANAIPYLDADGTIDSRVSDASTTVKGKVLLAEDGGTTPGTVVQVTDGRMTDARAPTEHASTHNPDGTDPILLATTSAPGLMGNGDKTKLDGINTSLIPTAAQYAALAGTYGTPGGDNRFVTDTDPRIGGEGPDITDLVNWAAFTDVELVSNGFTANASFMGRYLATIKESGTEKFVICTTDGSRQIVGFPLVEDFGTTIISGVGFWESARRIGDRTYFLLITGSPRVKYWDGSDDTDNNTNIGQTITKTTAMGYFNNYLFIGGSAGEVVRSDLDGNETTLTSGISERIVDFVEHEGSFYAVTRAVLGDFLGDFYLYDEANDTFTALNLTRRAFSSACSYDGNLLAATTTYEPIYVFVDTDFVETETQDKPRVCLLPYDDKLYAVERNAANGYNALFLYDTFTTPSVNLPSSEGSVNLPAALPIGSRKVIRKLGSDATKYITITPPAGCTIEGSNEYRLYGTGSYITVERSTSTLFSIKDYQERSETRSVKDFGAIGDGIIDDTASIQTAIDSGVNIYIPEGVYLLSDNLKVNNKTYIHGKGCLLSSVASKASLAIYASDCKIDGIEFDGNDITGCVAVYCEGDGLSVTNCDIHNFEAAGLQFSDIGTIKGYFVKNCYIHHNTGRGVYSYGQSEYGLIEGNIFWQNNIGFESVSGNNSVIGNNINSNAVGLRYVLGTNDSHSIVSGNNINHNTVYGIDVNGISESMMTINANHLFNSGCSVASVRINGVVAGRPIILSHNQIGGPVLLTNNGSSIYWNDNYLIEGPLTVTNTVVDYDRKSVGFQSRTLRYTGTWPASGSVTFSHGINPGNIIAVHASVRHSSGTIALPNYTVNVGYHYQVVVISDTVYLQALDGTNLFNQPYEVYIEYKL